MITGKTDFHMHSSCSDGLLPPEQLLECIQKRKVSCFSLTDHDTARGIAMVRKLLSPQDSIHFLPGAELTAGKGGRTHILIYGEVENPSVGELLRTLSQARRERNLQMLSLLMEQGFLFPKETAEKLSAGECGRLHFARELTALGYTANVRAAFDRYLLEGRCCYVPYGLPPASELLKHLSKLPVVPVLAHPTKMGLGGLREVQMAIEALIPFGLRGVECFHPGANARQSRVLESFARSHGLLVTGGSDFHGEENAHCFPGCTAGLWQKMEEDTEELFRAAEKLSSGN